MEAQADRQTKPHGKILINVEHELGDYLEDDKIVYELEFEKNEESLKKITCLMYTLELLDTSMFMWAVSIRKDNHSLQDTLDYINAFTIKPDESLFYCTKNIMEELRGYEDFNLEMFLEGLSFMHKENMFTTVNESDFELLLCYHATTRWFSNGKEFKKEGNFSILNKYSIFASSKEGTETIAFADTEAKAKLAISVFNLELKENTFNNTTSLENILGFDYDLL